MPLNEYSGSNYSAYDFSWFFIDRDVRLTRKPALRQYEIFCFVIFYSFLSIFYIFYWLNMFSKCGSKSFSIDMPINHSYWNSNLNTNGFIVCDKISGLVRKMNLAIKNVPLFIFDGANGVKNGHSSAELDTISSRCRIVRPRLHSCSVVPYSIACRISSISSSTWTGIARNRLKYLW